MQRLTQIEGFDIFSYKMKYPIIKGIISNNLDLIKLFNL